MLPSKVFSGVTLLVHSRHAVEMVLGGENERPSR